MACQKLNAALNSIYTQSTLDNVNWSLLPMFVLSCCLRIELIPVEISCILYAPLSILLKPIVGTIIICDEKELFKHYWPISNVMPCTSDLFDNVHTICTDTKLPSMLQYIPIAKRVAHCIKCCTLRCAHPDNTTSIVHATFFNLWSGRTIYTDLLHGCMQTSFPVQTQFDENLRHTAVSEKQNSITFSQLSANVCMCTINQDLACSPQMQHTADIPLIQI